MILRFDLPAIIALITAFLLPVTSRGHAIEGVIFRGGVAVDLRYADGSPAAGTQVSIFAPAATNPWLQCFSDESGRVVFFPDSPGIWRIEADDGMGHQVVLSLGIDPTTNQPPDSHMSFNRLDRNRFWPALAGLGCIWGIFGSLGWWLASRRR